MLCDLVMPFTLIFKLLLSLFNITFGFYCRQNKSNQSMVAVIFYGYTQEREIERERESCSERFN